MGPSGRRSFPVVCAPLLLFAAMADAQSRNQVSSDGFGGEAQLTAYYAARWVPYDGTPTPDQDNISGYIGPTNTQQYNYYWTQIELPNGASLDGLDFLVYDNDANGHIGCGLIWTQGAFPSEGDPDPAFDYAGGAMTGDGDTPGYTVLTASMIPRIIHAWYDLDGDGAASAAAYYLSCYAIQGDSTNTVRLWGALVHWHRTISPAPASATFADVPAGHWAFQHIEALSSSGITAGCGGGNFCPDSPLTRAQMAVFLAKALGLHWAY